MIITERKGKWKQLYWKQLRLHPFPVPMLLKCDHGLLTCEQIGERSFHTFVELINERSRGFEGTTITSSDWNAKCKEITDLEAKFAKIRELHKSVEASSFLGEQCYKCLDPYPCSTIRALSEVGK